MKLVDLLLRSFVKLEHSKQFKLLLSPFRESSGQAASCRQAGFPADIDLNLEPKTRTNKE